MSDEPQCQDRRPDFVIEMYRVYWANMARAMEGVWKVLGPVMVVGTVIAAVHEDVLPAPLGLSIAFVVVLWALSVTVDLNAWHRRNLFFLVRAERMFLSEHDYGGLLPAKYRTPPSGWITFYTINGLTFLVLLLLTALYAFCWKLPGSPFVDAWLLPLLVLAPGAALTAINAHGQERSARSHHRELFAEHVGGASDE
jgi:hypothetical protein